MAIHRFIIDLGGTNIRIGLVNTQTRAIDVLQKFPISRWDSLEACLKDFFHSNAQTPCDGYGAIAFAGILDNGVAKLTNSTWAFSASSLTLALGLKKICILNDFEAIAHGLPYLTKQSLIQLGGNDPIPNAPKVVLGAGTGLGCSYLIHHEQQWIAIATELGFTTLSGQNDREAKVISYITKQEGENLAENMLSGQGLCNIYAALCAMDNKPMQHKRPEDIAKVEETDPLATETLDIFLSFMGTCAANAFMAVNAQGGVYIAGGIAQKLQHRLKTSNLWNNFQGRGISRKEKSKHHNQIQQTPLYLITDDVPASQGLVAKVMELI